jgi:hypothetical protein
MEVRRKADQSRSNGRGAGDIPRVLGNSRITSPWESISAELAKG